MKEKGTNNCEETCRNKHRNRGKCEVTCANKEKSENRTAYCHEVHETRH